MSLKIVTQQTGTTLAALVTAGTLKETKSGIRFASEMAIKPSACYYIGSFSQPFRGVPGTKRDPSGTISIRVFAKQNDESLTVDMAELMDAIVDGFTAAIPQFRALVPSIYFSSITGEMAVDEISNEALGLITINFGYTKP